MNDQEKYGKKAEQHHIAAQQAKAPSVRCMFDKYNTIEHHLHATTYNSGYNHSFVVEQQPQNMDLSISTIYEKVMLTKNKGHDNLNT